MSWGVFSFIARCCYADFDPRTADGGKGGPHCPENSVLFQMTQLRTSQEPLFCASGQVSAQVREICTEQNLINRRYVAQQAKHGIACRKSCVPIDVTKVSAAVPRCSVPGMNPISFA